MRPNPEVSNRIRVATYVASNGYTNSAVRDTIAFGRWWSGSVTPNYVARKAAGTLPILAHSSNQSVRTVNLVGRYSVSLSDPNSWDVYWDTIQNIGLGLGIPDHSWEILHSSTARDNALNKIFEKVKDQKINVAQTIAERQQAMDLVGNTARTLAKTIIALKSGNFKAAAKGLGLNNRKAISDSAFNRWLELQYGWKPLLQDIRGAAEALARRQIPPTFKFFAQASDDSSHQKFEFQTNAGMFTEVESGYKSTAKVMLEYNLGDNPARDINQLGIDDPATLAWELLPYSFVADWFLPVGNYLKALSYDTGLSFKQGYLVQYTENKWSCYLPGRTQISPPNRTEWYPCNVVESHNIALTRTPYTVAPRPSFPSLKNPLSPSHMMSGIALLNGAFNRR